MGLLHGTLMEPGSGKPYIVFPPEKNPDLQKIMNGASRVVHKPAEGMRIIVKGGEAFELEIERMNTAFRQLLSVTLAADDAGVVMTGYNEEPPLEKGAKGAPGKLTDGQRKQADGTDSPADSSASAAKTALKKWGLGGLAK